jgi:hypothetical protein
VTGRSLPQLLGRRFFRAALMADATSQDWPNRFAEAFRSKDMAAFQAIVLRASLSDGENLLAQALPLVPARSRRAFLRNARDVASSGPTAEGAAGTFGIPAVIDPGHGDDADSLPGAAARDRVAGILRGRSPELRISFGAACRPEDLDVLSLHEISSASRSPAAWASTTEPAHLDRGRPALASVVFPVHIAAPRRSCMDGIRPGSVEMAADLIRAAQGSGTRIVHALPPMRLGRAIDEALALSSTAVLTDILGASGMGTLLRVRPGGQQISWDIEDDDGKVLSSGSLGGQATAVGALLWRNAAARFATGTGLPLVIDGANAGTDA